MSLKCAKLFFQPKSLSQKLVFLYSVSTTLIITIAFILLLPKFEQINHLRDAVPNEHALWEGCVRRLGLAFAFSVTSAVIFAKWITRNSMKCIAEFSLAMEKITADSLKDRIKVNVWPAELKKLGESYNTMLDRLEISFSQLSQFSSDIAHELRNPIHNLIGGTEVALSKENTVQEYRHVLESHIEEYQHLSRLVENLLFLARSDHGKIIPNKSQQSIQTIITHIIDYYQAMVDENNITLICTGEADLSIDENLFKRVISNLLSNAIKYTPKGGQIHITISTGEGSTLIAIEDNGIGIDEVHIPYLFNRFYRVYNSRTAQTGGLGLGLAIVKSIVELHAGTIKIKSIPHLGTRIDLEFKHH